MPKSKGSKGSAVSPRQDFTGIWPVFNRDLPFAFGLFVQAAQGVMDNSMKPRTFSAITLLPNGNSNGSIKIMNLSAGRVCTRSKRQLTPLPIRTQWINMLNIWAHVTNNPNSSDHWEYKGYYLYEEEDANYDATLMKVITSYLSPTRAAAPTEPVPELAVPNTFASILEEVESETDKFGGSQIGKNGFSGNRIGRAGFVRSRIGNGGFGRHYFGWVGNGGLHSGGSGNSGLSLHSPRRSNWTRSTITQLSNAANEFGANLTFSEFTLQRIQLLKFTICRLQKQSIRDEQTSPRKLPSTNWINLLKRDL